MEENDYRPQVPRGQNFNLFAGVILPIIAITLEATAHLCAQEFFDPIPTTWHLLLVIFVPLSQLHVWFTIRRGNGNRATLPGWLNAYAIGVSLFYSFIYLPLLPLAALTLLFIVGLLPLAPLLSLVAGIVMRHQLSRLPSQGKKSFAVRKAGLLAGLLITVALICALELPASLTRYGLKMARSSSPQTRAEGIRFLRTFGSKEYLLRACYDRSGWPTDFISFLLSLKDPVTPHEAQAIYYRVTGETFNTSVPPHRTDGRFMPPQDDLDFDADQGGAKINGKLKGLSLGSSKIDASADGRGGVAYMQWTLVFLNRSERQREARAEIQLPPGGVVSRLTLWVNGEEREAAFAGRGKVTQAYQQVVNVQRRDPVLVTTAGRDRVLVQCFPVPAYNGIMKIRLGITLPLVLENSNQAVLLLPYFLNRNFRIPDDVTHSTWIEAKTPMISDGYRLTTDLSGAVFALRGDIPDTGLSSPKNSIRLDRANKPIWSKDPFESGNWIIQQSIEDRTPKHAYRIVLVVDTSAAMENQREEIIRALRSFTPLFDVQLVLANPEGLENVTASGAGEILTTLRSATFAGGADNTTALIKAWDLAAQKPGNNVIVWVHSPQLLQLRSVEELKQRFERRLYGPTLYSIRTASGPDEIEKNLDGINEVKSVRPMNRLQTDLENLFARLTGQTKTLEWTRTSKKVDNYPDTNDDTVETSEHLARLWANDEVTRILNARDDKLNDAAITLAARYQLVTPVTGAVVLENEQQYRAAGLTPVNPGTVPTIPEPEMVALLIVAGVFLAWLLYRKCRTTGGCPV